MKLKIKISLLTIFNHLPTGIWKNDHNLVHPGVAREVAAGVAAEESLATAMATSGKWAPAVVQEVAAGVATTDATVDRLEVAKRASKESLAAAFSAVSEQERDVVRVN